MISRQWHGIARTEESGRYVAHLKGATLPHLARLQGFVDASILRRAVPEGVEFLVVTRWESLDAIRQFAGDDVDVAVVPGEVQAMMVRFDRTVAHYDVVE
jgi:heme-degrading monooxygenase HmoA